VTAIAKYVAGAKRKAAKALSLWDSLRLEKFDFLKELLSESIRTTQHGRKA
jgi:hypothetical protein